MFQLSRSQRTNRFWHAGHFSVGLKQVQIGIVQWLGPPDEFHGFARRTLATPVETRKVTQSTDASTWQLTSSQLGWMDMCLGRAQLL